MRRGKKISVHGHKQHQWSKATKIIIIYRRYVNIIFILIMEVAGDAHVAVINVLMFLFLYNIFINSAKQVISLLVIIRKQTLTLDVVV